MMTRNRRRDAANAGLPWPFREVVVMVACGLIIVGCAILAVAVLRVG
jgi:hypothetical protein